MARLRQDPRSRGTKGRQEVREARASTLIRHTLALLWLAAGCQLFSDFEISEVATTGCESGEVQCFGNVLQTCNAEGRWDNATVCASESLCDEAGGSCLVPVCAPGERRCLEAELQICNGTRDGWIALQTCATAGHCSTQAGGCMAAPCEPGEIECNGATLQSCTDTQQGWNVEATCLSPALCNEAEGRCDDVVCDAGEFQCQGAQLQECKPTLDGWMTLQVCDSAPLCDAAGGACGRVGCTTPGVFRCSEQGGLERCRDDLTDWESTATCESAAHCDAVKGTCMEEPCAAGAYQCSGAVLQICNAERTGWEPVQECETDGLCQVTLSSGATACVAPQCEEGTFYCEGPQPQICNAGRTGFRDNGTPCATAELCNGTTGTCAMPVCDPGQTRCTGAAPEVCNAGLTGYEPMGLACASVTLCNATTGTCGTAACEPGQTRCDPLDPTRLQRCNATLDDWDTCDTCESARLCSLSLAAAACDATSCQEPSCALTDVWCGGTDNRSLSKCPESRINTEAVVLDVCATPGLCTKSQSEGDMLCDMPSCALTDFWCGGNGNRSLYRCPPSRINSQAPVLDTCETNGLCEQARAQSRTTCPAPACEVGQTQCGGTGNRTLRMCRSDRTGYQDCDTCDTNALCTDSLGATTCNTSACRTCAAGQKQCSGRQLQVCNANRDGWTNLALCGSNALCMSSLAPSSQMVCDACVAGRYDCDGAQPLTCNDPGTGPTAWANHGAACDAAALCNASTGTCTCKLGETRCNASTGDFETCASTGWVLSQDCSMSCDAMTGCL